MMRLGILGEYVGRIFEELEELKERPLYVVNITANTGRETDVTASRRQADARAPIGGRPR